MPLNPWRLTLCGFDPPRDIDLSNRFTATAPRNTPCYFESIPPPVPYS
jgi:hypothetical protein